MAWRVPHEPKRAAASSGSDPALPHVELLDLPEELQQKIGRHALAIALPSALRCRQACTPLRDRLAAVEAEAQARRLGWVAAMTVPDGRHPEQLAHRGCVKTK